MFETLGENFPRMRTLLAALVSAFKWISEKKLKGWLFHEESYETKLKASARIMLLEMSKERPGFKPNSCHFFFSSIRQVAERK